MRGLELGQGMKGWLEHREKEYEQRELVRLSPETQVMCKIRVFYADEMEEAFL